jgi:hypothetical protein
MAPSRTYEIFRIALPDSPDAVVFVNGIRARTARGQGWLWRNLFRIRRATLAAEGCTQVKAGILGPREVIMVSYWRDARDLGKFVSSDVHRALMADLARDPEALSLFNETYRPHRSGTYSREPEGMATIYPLVTS